jgi:hypothetical protein
MRKFIIGLSALSLIAGSKVSGLQQFGVAVLLIALGRAALTIWPQPHPL